MDNYKPPAVKPKVKRGLGRPRRRYGLTLKCILMKWDVRMWTGLNWIRIESRGGLI